MRTRDASGRYCKELSSSTSTPVAKKGLSWKHFWFFMVVPSLMYLTFIYSSSKVHESNDIPQQLQVGDTIYLQDVPAMTMTLVSEAPFVLSSSWNGVTEHAPAQRKLDDRYWMIDARSNYVGFRVLTATQAIALQSYYVENSADGFRKSLLIESPLGIERGEPNQGHFLLYLVRFVLCVIWVGLLIALFPS